MDLDRYLREMVTRNASDLFLSAGAAPALKVEGQTHLLDASPLTAPEIDEIADQLLGDEQKRAFAKTHEMNIGITRTSLGRFRVNVYRQRGNTAIAIRLVPERIPTIESLNLPPILKDVIMFPRGLVLVVGASGSGKSTTLAAMIDHRNRHSGGHILTIEDPIEFLHRHEQSIVDQREVGYDTTSFADALRNAMREAPDVIMIGEVRDRETMEQALVYAQTGQLCLATLHANNANQALDRVLGFFPESAHKQVLMDLAFNLKAVVSQRLLHNARGGRRVPAVEILLQTSHVSDLILKGEIFKLKEAMKQGIDSGMMTFEESLLRLYQAGQITLDEALDNADSRADLALRVHLSEPLDAMLEEKQHMDVAAQQAPAAAESKRDMRVETVPVYPTHRRS
jgi:twitching motility protein PilU